MTSPGETLSNSVSIPEISIQQAPEVTAGLVKNTARFLGRTATRITLSLSLAISGGAVAGTATEMAGPTSAAAYEASTGDYPWSDATTLNTATSDYGYEACPSSASGCMTKKYVKDGKTYGEYDAWNYFFRNCTSYVAWRLNHEFGVNPAGLGNATKWNDNAPSKGWTVDRVPEIGDIAHFEGDDNNQSASPGHVAFVEEIGTDLNAGKVRVAEYNQGLNGNFRTDRWVVASNYIDVNGTNPTGFKLKLPPPQDTTTPTSDIRVPVAANFDGLHGDDLLGSTKRASPDITPNLNVFPSTGGWLGSNQLWSSPLGINQQEARMTAGDLDGDGKDDLFAIQNRSDGHPNIYWLRSEGSSFAAPELVGVPGLWFNDVKEWVSGDFNGDGHADLLAVSKRGEPTEDPAPNLIVFPSTGGWLGGSQLWGAPLSLKFADMKVIPADVDNDGKTDLLSVQPNGTGSEANPQIWWSRSTGSGFETPQLVGVPNLKANETKWVSGNFDGQGGVDLVTSAKRQDGASNLLVFRALSGWLGGSELWGSPAINWQAAAMVPADLDGDGKTDLISIQKRGDGKPDIIWSKSTGTGFMTPQIVGVPNLLADEVRWQS